MRSGQILIYNGEGYGGCTGCDEFHNHLQSDHWTPQTMFTQRLNKHHVSFPGIHDRWNTYIKL